MAARHFKAGLRVSYTIWYGYETAPFKRSTSQIASHHIEERFFVRQSLPSPINAFAA